jgi:hypothetical protein
MIRRKVPTGQQGASSKSDLLLREFHTRLVSLPWQQGRHNAGYSALLAAASLGVTPEVAFPFIAGCMERAGRSPEAGELERQWPNAQAHVSQPDGKNVRADVKQQTGPPCKKKSVTPYDGDFLRAFVKPLEGVSDVESYLKERSPLPVDISPGEFLSTVFPSPEKCVFFNDMRAPGWLHPDEETPGLVELIQPELVEGYEVLRNTQGMWYLCQPVNGEERINSSGKASIRSEENVASFRHIVIESDIGKQYPEQPDLWLRAVCLLELPIVSVIKSGNPRSGAHILVRVDAASKEAWQERKDLIKFSPLLGRLGADPAVYSAVRLTRLANVPRPDKGGFQTLLYLNPNPTGEAVL